MWTINIHALSRDHLGHKQSERRRLWEELCVRSHITIIITRYCLVLHGSWSQSGLLYFLSFLLDFCVVALWVQHSWCPSTGFLAESYLPTLGAFLPVHLFDVHRKWTINACRHRGSNYGIDSSIKSSRCLLEVKGRFGRAARCRQRYVSLGICSCAAEWWAKYRTWPNNMCAVADCGLVRVTEEKGWFGVWPKPT